MLKKTRSMQLMAPVESLTGKFALQRETAVAHSKRKQKPSYRYFGARTTSGYYPHMGGTVSKTSFYLRKWGRHSQFTNTEVAMQTVFGNAVKQANLDLKNISVVQTIKAKFDARTSVYGVDPRTYTLRGWVIAVYDSFYRYEEGQGAIDWANAPA